MIPLVAEVRTQHRNGRRRRFWFPLPLLWPPAIVLFAVAEALAVLSSVAMLPIRPRQALAIVLAPPSILYLLLQMSGLRLELARSNRLRLEVDVS